MRTKQLVLSKVESSAQTRKLAVRKPSMAPWHVAYHNGVHVIDVRGTDLIHLPNFADPAGAVISCNLA